MTETAQSIKIDHNLAYAVGLIATDGYLSSDKRHICLTSTDKQLLNTFKNCLNKTNRIGINPKSSISKKTVYRVQIGDVKLYGLLTKLGLHSRKSLTLKKIKITDRYFPDFLRGHLDGDGSIVSYQDRYLQYVNLRYIYQRLFVYFISASKKHLLWIMKTITRLTNLKGSLNSKLSKTQKGRHPMYVLKFSTKEAKKLLNWIYYKPDLPCLERKYLIAEPYLNLN